LSRRRELPPRLLLLIALLLISLAVLLRPDRPSRLTGSVAETVTAAAAVSGRSPAPLRVERVTIRRGDTLGEALDRLEVPPDLASRILAKAEGYVDPKRLDAGTGLSAARDESGRLCSVALRPAADRFLRVSWNNDGEDPALRTELLEIPLVATVESAGGIVSSSVAQALSSSPHARQLTQLFAEVFQWDVDLLVDPRPGDAVCIVYEALRLGELPADLPRFADHADEPGGMLRIGRILAATYTGRMADATAFWVEGDGGAGDHYDESGLPLRKAFLKSPLNYRRISSRFSNGRRHPVTRRVVPHHGVDFAAASGTPVVATADGRVSSAGWSGALGQAVEIRHNGEYTTVYGHLKRFARGVRRGAEVRQNQVIGYVGSTGRATGPHVHYTVRRYGRPIDPLRMKNPPVEPLDPRLRPWLAEAMRRWTPRLESIRSELELTLAGDSSPGADPGGVRPGA
jgi:murein DD-endopeptidase MepM/ murein hydrolase activator NlpD